MFNENTKEYIETKQIKYYIHVYPIAQFLKKYKADDYEKFSIDKSLFLYFCKENTWINEHIRNYLGLDSVYKVHHEENFDRFYNAVFNRIK